MLLIRFILPYGMNTQSVNNSSTCHTAQQMTVSHRRMSSRCHFSDRGNILKNCVSIYSLLWLYRKSQNTWENRLATGNCIISVLIIGKNTVTCTYCALSTHPLNLFIWALADGMCFSLLSSARKVLTQVSSHYKWSPGVTGHQYWTGISSMDLQLDC